MKWVHIKLKQFYNKYNDKHKFLFYTISFLCLFIFFIAVLATKGYSLKLYLTGFDNDTFMDYFNMLKVNRADTLHVRYQSGTIYPPLANLCYVLMNMALPDHIRQNFEINQYSLIIFFIYNVILLFFFSIIVLTWKKGSMKERYVFLGIILVSIPFIYMFERANIIFISLVLTMVFFLWKDSEDKILREISFIALALAAGIKIYPAIFGFLLVKKGRIKESLRLVAYGILSFLLPFLAYGWDNVPVLIRNLFSASDNFGQSRVGLKLAFSELIKFVCDIFSIGQYKETLVNILLMLIILSSVIGFIYMKKNWEEILLLTCLLIGIPKISGVYSGVFMVIPLIVLLDYKKKGKKEFIYLILILLTMLPLPFAFTEGQSISMYSSMYRTIAINVESFSIFFMTLGLIGENCRNFYLSIKSSHRKWIIIVSSVYVLLYSSLLMYRQRNDAYLINNFNRYVANDYFTVGANAVCSQTFIAKENELTSIVVRLGKINSSKIKIEIKENNTGKMVFDKEINKNFLKSYSLNEIQLKNVNVKKGQKYRLSFYAIDGDNTALTLYHSVEGYVFEEEYAIVDGIKKRYCLAINIYGKNNREEN